MSDIKTFGFEAPAGDTPLEMDPGCFPKPGEPQTIDIVEVLLFRRANGTLFNPSGPVAADAITTLRAEVERLRRCLAKDPKTLLIAFEDGDHMRLTRAAAVAIDRAEIAEDKLTTLRAENERLTALLKEVDDWVRGLEPFADAGHEPVTVFKKVRAALTAAEGEKP